MHIFPTSLAALSLATVLVAGTAQAAITQVSSTLTNLKFELIDLDANDNITPWVQFNAPTGFQRSGFETNTDIVEDRRRFDDGLLSLSYSYGDTTSFSSPDLLRSTAQVWTSDQVNLGFLSSQNERLIGFILSPNTRLQVTGTLALEATHRGSAAVHAFGGWDGYLTPGNVDGTDSSFFDSMDTEDGALTRDFSASLLTGATDGSGYLRFRTYALTQVSGIPMVPEPAEYAMLLAGIALIGARVRMRRG